MHYTAGDGYRFAVKRVHYLVKTEKMSASDTLSARASDLFDAIRRISGEPRHPTFSDERAGRIAQARVSQPRILQSLFEHSDREARVRLWSASDSQVGGNSLHRLGFPFHTPIRTARPSRRRGVSVVQNGCSSCAGPRQIARQVSAPTDDRQQRRALRHNARSCFKPRVDRRRTDAQGTSRPTVPEQPSANGAADRLAVIPGTRGNFVRFQLSILVRRRQHAIDCLDRSPHRAEPENKYLGSAMRHPVPSRMASRKLAPCFLRRAIYCGWYVPDPRFDRRS